MKKSGILAAVVFSLNGLSAQTTKDDGKAEVIKCSAFHITKPLNELIAADTLKNDDWVKEKKESSDRKFRIPYLPKNNPGALPKGEDPAAQKTGGTKEMKLPLVSWDGQPGSYFPPDPTGAAGPNHFVQAVNSEYKIYDKTGGSVSGGGPFSLATLLFGSDEGDPNVLYDKFADRWVITEFSITNAFYIGVSKTSDPTGSYYTYQFNSPDFPDYLKFSIWSDGYYMTSNQWPPRVFVLERNEMIAGNPAARAISKTYSVANDGSFFCPLSANADGQLPPAGTPCPVFSYEDDGWGSGYVDRINIYDMSVNWAATPTAAITLKTKLPTLPFDASYDYNWNDILQPGTNNKLDGLGGVFMFRAQYRVWTGYNTVLLCNGVLINPSSGLRGIRWYELRQDAVSGDWSIYQQSTFAPDNLNRWNASMAMDDNGSTGMAYSVSGVDGANSVFPGIWYTGRAASDPLNQMTYAEQIAATGNSAQTFDNRYGDYSQTSLDPADGTILWHTGEYILNGNPATKIFSFRIPASVGVEDPQKKLSINVSYANDVININAKNLPSNQELVVDLFDITGKKISGKTVVPAFNSVETSIHVSNIAKGVYLVRTGNTYSSFQKVTKLVIE